VHWHLISLEPVLHRYLVHGTSIHEIQPTYP
jgi:hypothetical protein